jgi:hypothetical protein
MTPVEQEQLAELWVWMGERDEFRGWMERATEQISSDDWMRPTDGWIELEPDAMAEVLAGLPDGQLAQIFLVMTADNGGSWIERARAGPQMSLLVMEEIRRRAVG